MNRRLIDICRLCYKENRTDITKVCIQSILVDITAKSLRCFSYLQLLSSSVTLLCLSKPACLLPLSSDSRLEVVLNLMYPKLNG